MIVNSKNANTCNANGVEVANAVCKLTADELGITADRVIVASTGVIGAPMSVEPFANAMHELAELIKHRWTRCMRRKKQL